MKGFSELLFYVCVAVGMALATTVFTMVGELFGLSRSPVILVAAVLGAAGVCTMLSWSIAELAGMFPSAPGIRTYLAAAFGSGFSLVLVYMYLAFVVLIAGVEGFMFALVVGVIFPSVPPLAVVAAVILLVAVINFAGLQLPRGAQMLTACAAILVILVSAVVGLIQAASAGELNLEPWPVTADLGALPAAAGMAIFMFMGFEWVTPLGLRPKSYQRMIPLSMPIAILVLTISYVALVVGMAVNLDTSTLVGEATPQVPYLREVYGPVGAYVALGLSTLAIFSTFNAGIMGGSRLISTLALERALPDWCGHRSDNGAPTGAISILAILVFITSSVVIVLRAEFVVAIMGASVICLVYASFVSAAPRLRTLRPTAQRPYKSPAHSALQWGLAVVLVVMGVGSTLGEAGFAEEIGVIGLILLSMGMALWSSRRLASKKPTG